MKKWFKELRNRIKSYAGIDGLQHLLVCYIIVVTFGLVDWIPGVIVAVFLSIFKECYDYSYRDKTKEWDWGHTLHDLIFDAIGILLGVCMCLLLG